MKKSKRKYIDAFALNTVNHASDEKEKKDAIKSLLDK
jgi:hypothetical protein